MAMKLHYFDAPGRAEATRLIFTLGGIPFEDKRYKSFEEAKSEGMSKGPYGQLPVLEFTDSGKVLAQSVPIERYAAKVAQLLPEGDDFEVAYAESLVEFCNDIQSILSPTMRISDPEEKVKARVELLSGKMGEKIGVLASLVEKFQNGFACGGKLSWIDIHLFVFLCVFSSGTIDGFPTNVLDPWPALQRYRHSISSIPLIKAYYEDIKEGGRLAMKPESTAAFA